MNFDVFTKEELSIAYKIVVYAIYILIITGVITSLGRLTLVYMYEGKDGLIRTIEGDTNTDVLAPVQNNFKETLDTQSKQTQDTKPFIAPAVQELPLHITAPSLGIDVDIQSPETKSVSVLDAALSKGPVYYQGSGTPGDRNMFIFGHSTGFSIVNNKAYKVFNNLKLAKQGEYIYIRTSSGTHTYVIHEVKKMSKYSTWVKFDSEKPLLTLSTCDSFGKASDRWVLEAEYVGFKKNQ